MFPSASYRCCPLPLSIISGSPPTERNARTGLFTPPTSTFSASAKICRERRRSGFTTVCVPLMEAPLRISGSQPAHRVFGMVGQNDFRARSLDSQENFEYDSFFVHPTLLSSRLDHRIFTAHIVSGDGRVEVVAHQADNIEIGQRRFHHQHVSALPEVQFHLPQSFLCVGRVHLVASTVSELRGGVRRLAEGPVEGGAVF